MDSHPLVRSRGLLHLAVGQVVALREEGLVDARVPVTLGVADLFAGIAEYERMPS
jgi:hypothetical protein